MKRNRVDLVTFDNETIQVKVKNISKLNLNGITVKFRYLDWLKDGVFGEKEYLLSPESLKILVDLIDSSNYKTKLNTTSSKEFLKLHPTLDSLKKSLAESEKLPKLGR